jgi:hypothetical protein
LVIIQITHTLHFYLRAISEYIYLAYSLCLIVRLPGCCFVGVSSVLTPSPAARDAASSFVALSDVDAHGRDIPPSKQTVGCSECTLFSA